MKGLLSDFSSEKAMTLIEVLASIVILSVIIISIVPIFVQSSRENSMSKNIMDSTTLAQSEMEEIINLNNNSVPPSLTNLTSKILAKGYSSDTYCTNCYGISKNGHYVLVQFKGLSANLGKAVLKIYKDEKKTKQEAQMEMILSWKN